MRERTNDVEVQRDVMVTMPDGVVLLRSLLATAGLTNQRL